MIKPVYRETRWKSYRELFPNKTCSECKKRGNCEIRKALKEIRKEIDDNPKRSQTKEQRQA